MVSIRFSNILLLLLSAIAVGVPLLASAATEEETLAATEDHKDKDKPSADDSKDDDSYAPVKKLDAKAYLGRWYQTYASASVIYTFQLGGNCVTATYYGTDKKGTIRVVNQVRPFASYTGGGKDDNDDFWGDIVQECGILTVNGFAAQSNVTDGALTVKLQPGPIPLGIGTPNIDDVKFEDPGNYWILDLGPKENDQYQWVIVSGPDKVQLYVLVRNVADFYELYEEEVLWKIKNYGFFTKFSNRPRKTNQEDCGYEYEFDDYHEDDDDDDDRYDNDQPSKGH